MATCNIVQLIGDDECVGDSLVKINTNFAKLDSNLCFLGQSFLGLDNYVKSLSAKQSPTIKLSFLGTTSQYVLSADVRDNSIGTLKLGQDIPQSTKVFLTAANISSLLDVSLSSVQPGQLLLWDGGTWKNRTLEDKAGAKILNELLDVELVNPLTQGQILRYVDGIWRNSNEDKNLYVNDGNYGDITVSNNGRTWDINPGVVGTTELANNAVTTAKILNGAVVNDKIANGTIERSKLAFTPGEINTGRNLGTGTGIYTGANDGVRLPFKTLRAGGAVTITDTADTITISVPNATAPAGATGSNLGFGEGKVYSTTQSSNGNLKFKSLKAGTGITITETNDEITISAKYDLGLSITGISNTGAALTESEVQSRVASIYPPNLFPSGSICRVELTQPDVTPIQSVTVTVPFGISYFWNGNKSNVGNKFTLLEPPVTRGSAGTPAANDYTGTKTYDGTATLSNQPTFRVPTRQTWTYTHNGISWSRTSVA
jgi:hypothetical protein